MQLSQAGLQFIAGYEGFRAEAYKPVASERYWTIGFGHYGPDVKPGMRITRERGLALLRADARVAEGAVAEAAHVRLSQAQFDALVSFTFNCGVGALRSSTLLRKLNGGDYASVPAELLRWTRGADGEHLEGLRRRREAEGAMFRTATSRKQQVWESSLAKLRRVAHSRKRAGRRPVWPQRMKARANRLKRLIARERSDN